MEPRRTLVQSDYRPRAYRLKSGVDGVPASPALHAGHRGSLTESSQHSRSSTVEARRSLKSRSRYSTAHQVLAISGARTFWSRQSRDGPCLKALPLTCIPALIGRTLCLFLCAAALSFEAAFAPLEAHIPRKGFTTGQPVIWRSRSDPQRMAFTAPWGGLASRVQHNTNRRHRNLIPRLISSQRSWGRQEFRLGSGGLAFCLLKGEQQPVGGRQWPMQRTLLAWVGPLDVLRRVLGVCWAFINISPTALRGFCGPSGSWLLGALGRPAHRLRAESGRSLVLPANQIARPGHGEARRALIRRGARGSRRGTSRVRVRAHSIASSAGCRAQGGGRRAGGQFGEHRGVSGWGEGQPRLQRFPEMTLVYLT
jgi:hypothetical protein